MLRKTGSAMLILLLGMAIIGLIAGQILPRSEVRTQRQTESWLRDSLADIRQVFDLKAATDPSFDPQLSTPQQVASCLTQLEEEKFLRSGALIDPSISPEVWNTGTASYWMGIENISFNTSFESTTPPDTSLSEVVASWSLGTIDTQAATDTRFFPSQSSSDVDDYEGQNKLGEKLMTTGQSLKIVK